MITLLWAVLVASLLGSTHCAGMCGAFVAFAVGAGDPQVKASRGVLLAAYQAGRLVTYMLLGIIGGIIGAGVDIAGRLAGFQQAAAIGAGAMMAGFGILTLLRHFGVHVPPMRLPSAFGKWAIAGNMRARGMSPVIRAAVTGLLTTLLPCGWLYLFVFTASGTGSGITGALVMAVFWVGTLPILTVVGLGARRLAGPLAARLPLLTASLLVAAGMYTIVARAHMTMPVTPAQSERDGNLRLIQQVRAFDQHQLPCCTQKSTTAPEAIK